MKKRVLASFIFLSSFSVLAAACGGNTKTQTPKHSTSLPKLTPQQPKTVTQVVKPIVKIPPPVKHVVHIKVPASDKTHTNVVNLIVKD